MALRIIVAILAPILALGGCAPLSSVTLDRKGVDVRGSATVHSHARFAADEFQMVTRHADPHYLQTRGGVFIQLPVDENGTVSLDAGWAEGAGDAEDDHLTGVDLILGGSGPFRASIVDTPIGRMVLYGGDDFEAEGVEYVRTEAGSITFKIARIGGQTSVVYAQLVQIVQAVYPDAWGRLTDAEKEVALERVRALLAAGQSVIDAVKTVLGPIPLIP